MLHRAFRPPIKRLLRRAVVAGVAGALMSVAPAAAVGATDGDRPQRGAFAERPAPTRPSMSPRRTAAGSQASVLRGRGLPASCRAAVTVVRPDTTLAVGVVHGQVAELYSTGVRLGYPVRSVAFVRTSTNRGITIDRFLVSDLQGVLHRVVITQRLASGSRATLADTAIGHGWQDVRTFVAAGPHLYALTTGGGLTRYDLSSTVTVSRRVVMAKRGWGAVKSLGYGGWWMLKNGRAADDVIGVSTSGRLSAYVMPRHAPTRVTSRPLAVKGWAAFSHVSAGQCLLGASRPIVGVKPDGSVYAYLDANANDQDGSDIRLVGRVATGWTGRVAD